MAWDDFSFIGDLFKPGTAGTGSFDDTAGSVLGGGTAATPAGPLYVDPSKRDALTKGIGSLGAGALKAATPAADALRPGQTPIHQPGGGDQLAAMIQAMRQRQAQRMQQLQPPQGGGLLGNF